MAIKILKSREVGATPELLIKDIIRKGKAYEEIAKTSEFYRTLYVNGIISDTIRDCNNKLGMSGSFKNGCLYREAGLSEFWKRVNGEAVVCDHAVPVRDLVNQYHDGEPIERLIFSPVVRIRKESNQQLTKSGYAKKGHEDGFPLFRYSLIDIKIVTHTGVEVDPSKWTESEHWELVYATEELQPVIKALALQNLKSCRTTFTTDFGLNQSTP